MYRVRYGIGITSQSEIEKWVFVYYCCKLLDFGDTMFMVSYTREPSTLNGQAVVFAFKL